MKEIQLTQGKVARVDDGWFDYLNQWKWQYDGGYARRTIYHGRDENGKRIREIVWMHRLIIDAPPDMLCDHIDGDVLNNQQSNLRLATRAENTRNTHRTRSGHSVYKGIAINQSGNFLVRIIVEEKQIALGTFYDEIASANVYNFFAKHFFGEFACLNDVPYMSPVEWLKYRSTFRKKGMWYDDAEWFISSCSLC